MKKTIIKLLAILSIELVFLFIHIISPLIAECFINFKTEGSNNIIFFILSTLAIWFIFFSDNKGGKHEK